MPTKRTTEERAPVLAGMTCTVVSNASEYSLELTWYSALNLVVARLRNGDYGPWYEARITLTILDVQATEDRMLMGLRHFRLRLGERASQPKLSLSDWDIFSEVWNWIELGKAQAD